MSAWIVLACVASERMRTNAEDVIAVAFLILFLINIVHIPTNRENSP